MSKHCVSLPIAKQLKEAGWPQGDSEYVWCLRCETLHYYHSDALYNHFIDKHFNKPVEEACDDWRMRECVLAPTVGELGEALPKNNYATVQEGNHWSAIKSGNPNSREFFEDIASGETEANARAEMWLWLKKEGHL